MKPNAPMIRKAISQPNFAARTGTVSGATRAPIDEPELNMDVAKALSFFGKYSAVALIADGKLPPSPSARTHRATMNIQTLNVDIMTAMSPVACTNCNLEEAPT